METMTFHVPAMYGDHHVLEVRRILLEMPGVEQVNASSCFQTVVIVYNPSQLKSEVIHTALEAHGYLQEPPTPIEFDTRVADSKRSPFLRHTTAYEGTQQVISFAQNIDPTGQPLWPCPGFGSIRKINDNG